MEQYRSSIVKTVERSQLSLHPAMISLWQALHHRGDGLFVVGGAVRDLLIGIRPHEYDFATDLEMKDLIEQATAWGLKSTVISQDLEVVALEISGEVYEVARMRMESIYRDGRHPERVVFTTSMQVDSQRRDFTVNGLYLDFLGAVYDFHQGYVDLLEGVLKPIGDPKLKMNQDALRLLRGIRIATILGLTIQREFIVLMQSLDYTLTTISMERRMAELRGILSHANWHRGLSLMENCGFMKRGFYLSPVSRQLKASTKPHQFIEVFAMLLALQGSEWTRDISERLNHYALTRDEKMWLKKYVWSYTCLKDPLEILFKQGEQRTALLRFFEGMKDSEIQEFINFIDQCETQGLPMSASEISISPKRLLELGVQGNQINAVLYELFLGVHKGFYLNTAFSLESEVKRFLSLKESQVN